MTQLRGVILDMDGTLIDSMPIWHEIDVRFFEENGLVIPDGLSEKVNKMSMAEWASYFVEAFHVKYTPEGVIRRIEEMAAEYYRYTIPLKPYVTEFLDFLDASGLPYGVATATYRSSAQAALHRLGIAERMQFLLTSEDEPDGKQQPAIFLRAAALLGSRPGETLVVEDALHCVRTAAAAGFPTAAVYDSCTPPEEWQELCRTAVFSGHDLREIMRQLRGVIG